MNFDHIFNWRLLSGSHKFPGPDGGTCINEAAVIAAGFKYRSIKSAGDCPKCFSRPIAAYALALNDEMPDGIRQRLLLRFVMRLAGTADSKNDGARIEFIALETTRRVVARLCEFMRRQDLAERCRDARNIWQAMVATAEIYAALHAADKYVVVIPTRGGVDDVSVCSGIVDATGHMCSLVSSVFGVEVPGRAADIVADAARVAKDYEYFEIAAEILDEAIRLGRHSDIDVSLASERLEHVRPREILCEPA